jgi:hypothetical protein
MTQEEYNKTLEILKHFPDYEIKYNKSAMFHKVVQMLVRLDDPYLVIDQLILSIEDINKAFEQYIITDNRPLNMNR